MIIIIVIIMIEFKHCLAQCSTTAAHYCTALHCTCTDRRAVAAVAVAAACRGPVHQLSHDEHLGRPEALGADVAGTRVLSTRMPGVTNAMVEVSFGLPGETLTLRCVRRLKHQSVVCRCILYSYI